MNQSDFNLDNATIREATTADADAILQIYRPYIESSVVSFEAEVPNREEIAGRINRVLSASYPWLVLEHNSIVCGYAYATQFRARDAYRHSAETTVYVHSEFHRCGIGSLLMERLLNGLRADGFHLAIAGVTLPNPGSVALHERLGFEAVGVFPQVGRKFDAWHDVGFWSLKLNVD